MQNLKVRDITTRENFFDPLVSWTVIYHVEIWRMSVHNRYNNKTCCGRSKKHVTMKETDP